MRSECFQTVWDLMKAIDYDDFTIDDILGDESFGNVKGKRSVIYDYLTSPEGKKEIDKIKARRIDYDLEGGDLFDYKPKTMWDRTKELQDIFGGSPPDVKDWQVLSAPGKMINRTFSLPTHICERGGILRNIPKSVCRDCYAHRRRSNYATNPTQQKLMRNLDRLTTTDPTLWASAMAYLIRPETMNFPVWRWHDSGENINAPHVSMIADIADKTPDILHWLPTREWEMVKDVFDARSGSLPKNLAPRISLPMINQTLDNEINEQRGVDLLDQDLIDFIMENPQIDYSEVITKPEYATPKSEKFRYCPASNKLMVGNKCLDHKCMACFNPKIKGTGFYLH